MIIDFHTHTYPDSIAEKTVAKLKEVAGIPAHGDGTADGLSESTKAAGIDYALILPVATNPHQVSTINEVAYKTNLSSKRKGLLSFGAIHPDSPDYKRVLRGIASLGLQGIKLHPDYQGAFFHDIRYKRIVDAASELGLWIVVHAGVDIGLPDPVHTTPGMVREVLRDTGTGKLILAHMGGWRMWDQVMEKLVGEDVRIDTSFSTTVLDLDGMLDEEAFVRIVRAFGADRVLFGTDSPWASQRKSLKWIEHSPLRKEEKEKILGKNAESLLKLRSRSSQ
ncbi:MAG: amidohydrolase family protein [Eubacterium sp.]|nr:amidohydrolase family protein [Eubacterium sp.]